MKQKDSLPTIILVCILTLFSALVIILIEFPISQIDENIIMVHVFGVLNNINFLVDQIGHSFEFFGRRLPLAFTAYHICIEHYLFLPFFAIFGVSIVSSRIAGLFYSLLTLLFTYYFVKELFNKKIALISTFLLATSISFILGTNLTIYTGSVMQFMISGSLCFFILWYKNKKMLFFYLAMFFLGLGLNTRGWYIWFLIAFLTAALFFFNDIKNVIFKNGKRTILKYFLSGFIFFCLGGSLFIYSNLKSKFGAYQAVSHNFPITSEGINNLDYWHNFYIRLRNLALVLKGHILHFPVISIYKNHLSHWSNNLSVPIFACSLLWLIGSIFWGKEFRKQKYFLLIIIFTTLLLSPFTLSNFDVHHLFIILPFICIVMGYALYDFVQRSKNFFFTAPVITAFVLMTLFNITLIINKYLCLDKAGGIEDNSYAIYELTDWIEQKDKPNAIVMEENLNLTLMLLSNGKILPRFCALDYRALNKSSESLFDYFSEDENICIFKGPEFVSVDYHNLFLTLISKSGKRIIETKEFLQKDGKIVYIAYVLR